MTRDSEELIRHFRPAFDVDPAAAFRDWYRAQEELRDSGDADSACALADDLWARLPGLSFDAPEARARFLHNAAVFFGSPGPAENLGRARAAFSQALEWFESSGDEAWAARVRHNFATSLSNLGISAADLDESVALFRRALEWRTAEREIARGVTLHHLGLALRRLAELDPERATERLAASAGAFEEACDIRRRHALEEGRARSLFHRGVTLRRLSEIAGNDDPSRSSARECLEEAAREFDRLGNPAAAAAARDLLEPGPGAAESRDGPRGRPPQAV